jgi:hypothetical protein
MTSVALPGQFELNQYSPKPHGYRAFATVSYGLAMKLRLRLLKNEASLAEGIYVVSDAESFGRAFSDVWQKLIEKKFGTAGSIGALYDSLDDSPLADLDGARIHLQTVEP